MSMPRLPCTCERVARRWVARHRSAPEPTHAFSIGHLGRAPRCAHPYRRRLDVRASERAQPPRPSLPASRPALEARRWKPASTEHRGHARVSALHHPPHPPLLPAPSARAPCVVGASSRCPNGTSSEGRVRAPREHSAREPHTAAPRRAERAAPSAPCRARR